MGRKSKQKKERAIIQGRLATLSADLPWTPMEPAVGSDGSHTMTDGEFEFTVFKNSRYTVMRREFLVGPDYPSMVHLSVKRNDRRPIVSWRDMQKIKNELVGPECEGVQIFPAESRLVDTSSQYHLWVCSDPDARLPFGYQERLVYEGNSFGAVQEPFEEHVRPKDLISKKQMEEEHQKHFDRYGA